MHDVSPQSRGDRDSARDIIPAQRVLGLCNCVAFEDRAAQAALQRLHARTAHEIKAILI